MADCRFELMTLEMKKKVLELDSEPRLVAMGLTAINRMALGTLGGWFPRRSAIKSDKMTIFHYGISMKGSARIR